MQTRNEEWPPWAAVEVRRGARQVNLLALAGLVLGLASVVCDQLEILPVLGLIFSTFGLTTFQADREKFRWLAGVGLGISLLTCWDRLPALAQLGT